MTIRIVLVAAGLALLPALGWGGEPAYPIADSGQAQCYDDQGRAGCPAPGKVFFGQDAQYRGLSPSYRDNGDGTVSDLVTGLMWEKGFHKTSFSRAGAQAAGMRTGGHADWRVPNIKELYSLINFLGNIGRMGPGFQGVPADARPYLDSRFFDFEYPSQGRFIDAQYVTSTAYLGLTMGRDRSFFGVNFADGRIKAYPQDGGPGGRVWYARYVRGNPDYGRNDYQDNGDGTVADRATSLMWTKADSGDGAFRPALAASFKRDGRLDWGEALAFCEKLNFAGHGDWRLPNAKELHSIVDYRRSPTASQSAAIDPVFAITPIRDEEEGADWPFFWTSTSHLDGRRPGDFAVYFAFGRAFGYIGAGGPPGMMGGLPPEMAGNNLRFVDVHGAGAQRSSPKSGDESRLPKGAGPQGDVLRIYNFARCVRGG